MKRTNNFFRALSLLLCFDPYGFVRRLQENFHAALGDVCAAHCG